jgi:hypothetical protein
MTDLTGARLGDFEIVREMGRGGMGEVYEARQVSLNRVVALKVLSGGLGLTPNAVQRFRREAEAAAKLHHTNIVPVYATGEERGTHFYAMELIDGPSLDRVIREMRGGPDGDTRSESPASAAATGPYVPAEPTPPPSGSGSGARSSAERFDRAAERHRFRAGAGAGAAGHDGDRRVRRYPGLHVARASNGRPHPRGPPHRSLQPGRRPDEP